MEPALMAFRLEIEKSVGDNAAVITMINNGQRFIDRDENDHTQERLDDAIRRRDLGQAILDQHPQ